MPIKRRGVDLCLVPSGGESRRAPTYLLVTMATGIHYETVSPLPAPFARNAFHSVERIANGVGRGAGGKGLTANYERQTGKTLFDARRVTAVATILGYDGQTVTLSPKVG